MGCCAISCIFSFIVLFQIFKIVLPWLYKNLIGPKLFGSSVDVRKMGEWALVTGATDGIGKAYAKALAKKGLNIILISRSAEKLDNVAKELETSHGIKVKTIAIDFTDGTEIYKTIKNEIQNLEIGVLVNNVGISYPHPQYFLEIPDIDKFLQNIVSCNINSVTYMTSMILPQMVERKKGVIINVSSMSAKIPNPLLCVYSGTKAFVDKFSEDLGVEYKQHGIIVQSVMPGFVATNMSKIRKPTFMSPSADTYVESALQVLGIDAHTYGYFPHVLMKLMIDTAKFVLPLSKAYDISFKQLLNIRNRALKQKKSN